MGAGEALAAGVGETGGLGEQTTARSGSRQRVTAPSCLSTVVFRAASRGAPVTLSQISRLDTRPWPLKSRMFDSLVAQPVFPKGPLFL